MKSTIEVRLPEGWSTEELEELIKNGAQVLPKKFPMNEMVVFVLAGLTAFALIMSWFIGPWRISAAFHRWFEQPYERVIYVTPTTDLSATPTETKTPTPPPATRWINNEDSGNIYRYQSKVAYDHLVAARETLIVLHNALPGFTWCSSSRGWCIPKDLRAPIVAQTLWKDGLISIENNLSAAGAWLANTWSPGPSDSSNPLLDTHARLSLAWGELVRAYDILYCVNASPDCINSPGQHWLDMAGANLDSAMVGWNLSKGFGSQP
jgi:hypothetical protein